MKYINKKINNSISHMMKATSFIKGVALGLPLTFLAACSSDTPDGPQKLDYDQVRYVSVAISSLDDMSRAEGDEYDGTNDPAFSVGEEAENKVFEAYFVFFDENGNWLTSKMVSGERKDKGTDAGNYKWVYEGVVPVELAAGQTEPSQMMVFLNPVNAAALNRSLSELEVEPRTGFYGSQGTNASTGFAMSNSVYYGTPGLTDIPGTDALPQPAIQLTNDLLHDTEAEAQTALDNLNANSTITPEEAKVAVAHVERYCAKVNLTYNDAQQGDIEVEGNTFTLGFEPEKWIVNATDKQVYVSKSFRREAADGSLLGENMTFGQLEETLNADGRNWKWNSPANYRSYWGRSPSYYEWNSPETSADVSDQSQYSQNYYSFAQMLEIGTSFTSGSTTTRYENETTTSKEALLNATNPAATLPSLTIIGRHTLYKNGEKLNGNHTFYIAPVPTGSTGQPQIFFGNDIYGISTVEGGQTALSYMIPKAGSLQLAYKINGKSFYVPLRSVLEVSPRKLADMFEVVHPSAEALKTDDGTEVKMAARKVILQMKSGLRSNVPTSILDDYTQDGLVVSINVDELGNVVSSGGTQVNAVLVCSKQNIDHPLLPYVVTVADAPANNYQITVSEVNRLLVSTLGNTYALDSYNEGRAYYYIPIKHLGWYAGTNPNKDWDNDIMTLKWEDVRPGDFGLVRNHWYRVNVTGVTGLGIGVNRPDDPIVPPKDVKTNAVAYQIRILNWALVPTQSLEL